MSTTTKAKKQRTLAVPPLPLDLAGLFRWDPHPNATGEVRLQSAKYTTKWYYIADRAIGEAQRWLLSQSKAETAKRVEYVPLDQIRIDGGTQARAGLDEPTVAEYAETWLNLSHQQNGFLQMPPIVVYYDGSTYWLADGFHRVAAYRRFINGPSAAASARALRSEIRQGTRRDAVLYACGANASHGLRRSTADKERAVLALLTDQEWGQWSDREIARQCKVSHDFVGKVADRNSVTGRASSERKTADGRTMNVSGISQANTDRTTPAEVATPFWQSMSPNHPTAHLWSPNGHGGYKAACGMIHSRHPEGSTESDHCSSCVRATWKQQPAEPVPITHVDDPELFLIAEASTSIGDGYLNRGKIRRPFRYADKLWINVGASFDPRSQDISQCVRVVPVGEAYERGEPNKSYRPGSYTGDRARHGGVEYELTGQWLIVTRPHVPAGQAAAPPEVATAASKPSASKPPSTAQFRSAQERAARLNLDLAIHESGAFSLTQIGTKAPAGGAVDWPSLCDLLDRKELARSTAPALPDVARFGFTARALPNGQIGLRSKGNLETEHTPDQVADLIAFWQAYPPIPADMAAAGVAWRYRQDRMYQLMHGDIVGQTGYSADEALSNQRDYMQRTGMLGAPAARPAEPSCTRCGAKRSERRSLTSYGPGLIEEYLGSGATLCSVCIPELLRAQRERELAAASDRAAYEAKEAADARWLDLAEVEIASGNVNYARQMLDRVQVSTYRRDQLLSKLPAPATGRQIALALSPDDCAALLREARVFSSGDLTKKLPAIGQLLVLVVEGIKGEAAS